MAIAGLLLLLGPGTSLGDSGDDARIQERIQARLKGQVSVTPQDLQIQVSNGVVHLSGSVGSLGEKRSLERLAGSMVGVTAVFSDLAVRQSQRSQFDIIEEIRLVLELRPRFRNVPIVVAASDGEVTLSGTVDRALDRFDAEALAGGVEGVVSVVNQIAVRSEGRVAPQAIRDRVFSILSNPLIFGVIRDLSVEVSASSVTLRGLATRPADRLEAERLVLAVPGVTQVENLIEIAGS